mmetsp:Transcript_15992/g.24100  ORF Transcript_15992/g.24100 Transcript_15992/m.24100 type:complete len:407 (+) Transcript_15992:42-1262(+)
MVRVNPTVILAAAFIITIGVFYGWIFKPQESPFGKEATTLREAGEAIGLPIGTCVGVNYYDQPQNTTDQELYRELIHDQASLIVAENSCKWPATEPSDGVFDFTKCDIVRDIATKSNQIFRGHNLCWGVHNPDWLVNGNFTSEQLKEKLIRHVKTLVKKYGTDAFAWDVVNEALTDDQSTPTGEVVYKVSDPWYPAVPDYVELAFTAAAEARTSDKPLLFYNDYGVSSATGCTSHKSDMMYNMVKELLSKGVPIDGVGFQMHLYSGFPDAQGIESNFKRFADLGLKVMVTELDVLCSENYTEAEEEKEAELYAAVLAACMDENACIAFGMWGLTDLHSWRKASEHPLPFDDAYKPKLVFKALLDTLNGNRTWVSRYYQRHSLNNEKRVTSCDDAHNWRDFLEGYTQ